MAKKRNKKTEKLTDNVAYLIEDSTIYLLLSNNKIAKEEFGIDVKIVKQLYYLENEKMDEYFFLCEYVSGEMGTGDGPEFSGDPKYKDRGTYTPKIVAYENGKEKRIFGWDVSSADKKYADFLPRFPAELPPGHPIFLYAGFAGVPGAVAGIFSGAICKKGGRKVKLCAV